MEATRDVVDGQDQYEVELDLMEVFHLLRSKWKSLFAAMLVGAVLGSAYLVFAVGVEWKAETSLYVTSTDTVISVSEVQLSSLLTEDYSSIIESKSVLNEVIAEVGLDMDYKQLKELLGVSIPDSSHVIYISVTMDDPKVSCDVANTMASVSAEYINRIVGNGMPTVIDKATISTIEEVRPSVLLYALVGGVFFAAIVAIVCVGRMLMDSTIKSEEEIRRYLQVPLLAFIPYSDMIRREEQDE